jgi:hypothetical protein
VADNGIRDKWRSLDVREELWGNDEVRQLIVRIIVVLFISLPGLMID